MSESNNISEFTVPGQFRYENMLLSPNYPVATLEQTSNFPMLNTDIILASYMKTGSTLLAETVWLLRNNADVEASKKTPIDYRVFFINKVQQLLDRPVEDLFDAAPRPRCLQTHVPSQYLPKAVINGTSKCISILRNPKDTLVSFYHYHRSSSVLGNFPGTWNDFFEYFKRNDYFLMFGNLIDHMLDNWEKRDRPNFHIVFYEDLVMNKEPTVRKIDDFLETKLSDEKIAKIVEATSFEKMKESDKMYFATKKPDDFQLGKTFFVDHSISPYMRKGKVGDWKNYFDEHQNRIMDEMIEKKLSGTGLKFVYE